MPLDPAAFTPSFAPAFVDRLLRAIFAGPVPERLDRLVDRDVTGHHLLDYKTGPIFPVGCARPSRLYVSSVGEGSQWLNRVRSIWEPPGLEAFVSEAPASTRLMLDSDGVHGAELYLDDLQDVDHAIESPDGRPVMSATLAISTGERSVITRLDTSPLDAVEGRWRESVQKLLDAGAVGTWAVRWVDEAVAGVLLVTETRSWNDIEPVQGVVDRFEPHPGLARYDELLAGESLASYPDSIEIRPDGSHDITVGIVHRRDR